MFFQRSTIKNVRANTFVLGHFKDTSSNISLRIIEFAGLIELRENMPTSLIKNPKVRHLLITSFVGICCSLLPKTGFSLEISTPVGVHQIGKRLDLKSTLSNLPDGAESQLRSTCLTARVNPLETSRANGSDVSSRDVKVNFSPTIRRGGLLEFKSVSPVNDALIEIELVSECPLVVFSTRWAIIMSESQAEVHQTSSNIEPNNIETNKQLSKFDPASSSLLASTRKPPVRKVEPSTWSEVEVVKKKDETVVVEKTAPPTPTIEPAPAEDVLPQSEPMKIASLNTELMGAGLIESQPDTANLPMGSAMLEGELSNNNQTEPLQNLKLMGGVATSVLLILGFLTYCFIRYRSGRRSMSIDIQPKVQRTDFNEPTSDLASISRDHAMAFTTEPATIGGTNRVLDSLMGVDENHFDEAFEPNPYASSVNSPDMINRSTMTICIDLINRADVRSWNLPASYSDLVASRNRSLQLHRTPDALLLRSQISLVELAFQDAKQGQLTHANTSLELLDLVLGEQVYEIGSMRSMGVPDVLKSHVRAKMCEITGAENRQILRENLVNLNTQVTTPSLCFGSNDWREFLSQEGILE